MTAYRLDHAGTRSNVGVPVASAVTISPRGEVFDGPVATEPGRTSERAVMVWHANVVDEALAAFLVDRGYGGRLRPLSDEKVASPRTEFSRVATPQHVAHWYAAEVAAGRIVPPEQFPPPAVRRRLREAQGLSRPAVGELVGVSGEAVRLWETGDREPSGDKRNTYLDLLNQWANPPESEPEPCPRTPPSPRYRPATRLGCATSTIRTGTPPSRICGARDGAYAGHRAKMAHLTGRST
jgi:DNA-binding transcriptional regulator YiaG